MQIPANDGYKIMPREGHALVLEFPIYEASEIDGTAFVYTVADGKKPASKKTLALINAANKVIATAKTEFDGYFLFPKILPGTYRIVQANASGGYAAGAPTLKQITVEHADFYTGNDVTLTDATAPAGVP